MSPHSTHLPHDSENEAELIRGLTALAESTFPKKCACCGRVFDSVADYVAQTSAPRFAVSCFKQSCDEEGRVIVDLFRNCNCGSTLMSSFLNRRDPTSSGEKRRHHFEQLLDQLTARGMERHKARSELLKIVRGGASPVIPDRLKTRD